MTKGRSIRLFLADGTPGGIITAEIMNWTGHVMVAPRSRLADLIRRPEAGRTGIYILSGTDPEGGYKPLVYVGESFSVGNRLAQHNKDDTKEFWEQTCVVTSKDSNLTKTHAQYLESRMIQIAAEAARVKLTNSTAPDLPLLPEADLSDMEFFIEQLRVVLPVLGLEVLKEAAAKAKPQGAEAPLPASDATAEFPIFELVSKRHDLKAEAREIDGEFVVLAGSLVRLPDDDRRFSREGRIVRQLRDSGVLVPSDNGHSLTFVKDQAFTSPSAAGGVVTGRSCNGRKEWCVKGTKKTYAEWQDEQIAAIPESHGGEE